ncbi:MAG: polysaccharide pyruvyl transferase family protein [Actinobacteria bacterium]|nr:polysaccharide pyruvyl transferase family protein [Actinomycetota bacterium]
MKADEVFITSTTREISWVGRWDGKTVGGGRCGPVTLRLHKALRERVVRPVKRQVFLWHGINAAARTPLAKQLLDRALFEEPSLRGLPVYAADISLPWLYSFDQFTKLVARAAAVVTTRLHVGILAALLGKPTWIKPGTFHKIRGIYEFSMAGMDHVRLV